MSVVQVGALLKDAVSGEERFRIDSLLTDGKNYQIALAVDTRMDDKQVCVKTIEYSALNLIKTGITYGISFNNPAVANNFKGIQFFGFHVGGKKYFIS